MVAFMVIARYSASDGKIISHQMTALGAPWPKGGCEDSGRLSGSVLSIGNICPGHGSQLIHGGHVAFIHS